jgi:hypothetical protein
VYAMGQPVFDDREMGKVLERLHRVTKIQRVLVDSLSVLETMTVSSQTRIYIIRSSTYSVSISIFRFYHFLFPHYIPLPAALLPRVPRLSLPRVRIPVHAVPETRGETRSQT